MFKKIKIRSIKRFLLATLVAIMFPISIINFIYGGETVQVDEEGREISQGIVFPPGRQPKITWFVRIKLEKKFNFDSSGQRIPLNKNTRDIIWGSGILLTSNYILTAYHVVEHAINNLSTPNINNPLIKKISVNWSITADIGFINEKEKTYKEDVKIEEIIVHNNEKTDIALLKIDNIGSITPFFKTNKFDETKIVNENNLPKNRNLTIFGVGQPGIYTILWDELKKMKIKFLSKVDFIDEIDKYYKEVMRILLNKKSELLRGKTKEEQKNIETDYSDIFNDYKEKEAGTFSLLKDKYNRINSYFYTFSNGNDISTMPGDSGGPVMIKKYNILKLKYEYKLVGVLSADPVFLLYENFPELLESVKNYKLKSLNYVVFFSENVITWMQDIISI